MRNVKFYATEECILVYAQWEDNEKAFESHIIEIQVRQKDIWFYILSRLFRYIDTTRTPFPTLKDELLEDLACVMSKTYWVQLWKS